MTVQFHVLAYLSARHWMLSRVVFAVVGFGVVMGLTGRVVLARTTAGLFWVDAYKTALHQIDWFVHYGWPRHVLRRHPAFDITQDMPAAGLTAVSAMLTDRTTPADLRAQLYLLSAHGDHSGYCRLATRLVAQMPAPVPDLPKQAQAFTQAQARTALAAAQKLLTMPWYIVSGTLLGAVRGGDFLAHDYDIDIGVHAEDFDHDAFLEALRGSADFCLVRVDDYVDLVGPDLRHVQTPALYKIMHHTGVELDVFLHYLSDGQRWHGSARHRWWNVAFDVAPYDLAGLTVMGPANAEVYLTENYGDWRTPKTEFDSSTGTPNVSFNRNLVSIAQFLLHAQGGSGVAQSVLISQGYIQGDQFVLPAAQ